MAISEKLFGYTNQGQPVIQYTISNAGGAFVNILTYGGTLQSLCVPDHNGVLRDVVFGFDTMEKYEAQRYCGALIGRYANRIPGGKACIQGKTYTLSVNDQKAPNHLHGGFCGFHQKIWEAQAAEDSLVLHCQSPAGEDGYPGTLDTWVTYRFSDDCSLEIDYRAVCDRPTPLSLTNHAYFNLEGHDHGSVLSHHLQIQAALYTENDADNVATGAVLPVDGTPLDFRSMKPISDAVGADYPPVRQRDGIDLNYVIQRGHEPGLVKAATLYAPLSGIGMDVWSTELGLQVYTANLLQGNWIGKSQKPYPAHSGICLETQRLPNAVSHGHFPNPLLLPGQEYRHRAMYQFYHHQI